VNYGQWVHTFFPLHGETGNVSQTGDYHECEFDRERAHAVSQGSNARNVWTMVEGDDGESWYIVPGFHVVNRIGHVLTLLPWTDEHEALCIPYIEAADEPRYCDDCGDVLWQASQVHAVEALPVGIPSANAGESATLCAGCYRRICETGGDGDA
jgi:hypothetical protein